MAGRKLDKCFYAVSLAAVTLHVPWPFAIAVRFQGSRHSESACAIVAWLNHRRAAENALGLSGKRIRRHEAGKLQNSRRAAGSRIAQSEPSPQMTRLCLAGTHG